MRQPPAVIQSTVLTETVLSPLAGRAEADWYLAPPGKWCPAQIVHHLALVVDASARTFESRRAHAPMRRRPRSPKEVVGYWLLSRVGWIPGRRRAPTPMRPEERPERAVVERQFRNAVERFLALERELLPARRADLFVKHPALGDLTLPEWEQFHIWHCRHHARQIRERLAG